MNKTFEVARWEYLEKVRSKAFIMFLMITPLMMLMMGVLPSMLANRPDSSPKIIGVVDQTKEFTQPLQKLLDERFKLPDKQPNYVLMALPTDSGYKKIADSLALSEQIEGYLIISPNVMADSGIAYHSENIGNFKIVERLTNAVNDVIIRKKLTARNIDTAAIKDLTTHLDIKTIKLSKSGKEEESGFEQLFIPAYVFLIMMFFVLMTSGQLLVRSMLEEKSNRVVEVLVSSCSPMQLMMGKVVGLSGLGITQLFVWILIGVGLYPALVLSLFTPSMLVLPIYFVFGYVFYSAVFVAIGSPVSTEQEAQQVTSYLMILLVVPIALAFQVISDPNSMLVKILTYIPFLTPTMMALRVPVQMPSSLEIISTAATLGVSAVFMMWAAGKIFRVAILVTGKRPSFQELIRIVRSS
jgi:ABC-2 type transport system permease protein